MRQDYSTPVVAPRSARSALAGKTTQPDDEKQVDYGHLDIIAEAERIIERRLVQHTRISGKYHCACPFPDCTSKHDAFTVWDRPRLEERGDGRREVHFWCGRCGRTGSLISLLRQYREATTGEQLSWADAARALRIDPQTWRARDESDQDAPRRETASARRRLRAEQQRKAEQTERATLDALYRRARAWLAAGQITMKDGRTVALDQAQAYLQARGYTLEQAARLGLAYIPTAQEVPELAHLVAGSWRGRILFPLSGPAGASGYAGRTLWRWTPGMTAEQHKHLLERWNEQHPDKRVARHYKTHQPAYYGYEDACRASILVIVEGEFDAASIRLALADTPDIAVCAFGTNVQARLVPVHVLHVVLALDSDQAGQEALERLMDVLQARGISVSVALPPMGKDWNDSHQLAGLEAIRTAITRACDDSLAGVPAQEHTCTRSQQEEGQPVLTSALSPEHRHDTEGAPARAVVMEIETLPSRPMEPPGYEHGDVCLVCGHPVDQTEGAFYVCEDKASMYYGDLFCTPCWERQHTPLHLEPIDATGPTVSERLEYGSSATELLTRQEQRDQFTEASSRCARHHRLLRYSDELGGRYCDHVDCWERYRLMRLGAAYGYPALAGIVDPRDYLPDTSQEPLFYTDAGVPVYPARPALVQRLITAGVDAWQTYARERAYQDIDSAIKALQQGTHEGGHRSPLRSPQQPVQAPKCGPLEVQLQHDHPGRSQPAAER